MGCALIPHDWCLYKRKWGHRNLHRWEMMEKTQGGGGPETDPPHRPLLPAPWSRVGSLQNCKIIDACCLSCKVDKDTSPTARRAFAQPVSSVGLGAGPRTLQATAQR